MTYVEYAGHETTATINGQDIRLRVSAAVLDTLRGIQWGDAAGRKTGAALVEEYRPMLERIAAKLINEGQILDNLVVITKDAWPNDV